MQLNSVLSSNSGQTKCNNKLKNDDPCFKMTANERNSINPEWLINMTANDGIACSKFTVTVLEDASFESACTFDFETRTNNNASSRNHSNMIMNKEKQVNSLEMNSNANCGNLLSKCTYSMVIVPFTDTCSVNPHHVTKELFLSVILNNNNYTHVNLQVNAIILMAVAALQWFLFSWGMFFISNLYVQTLVVQFINCIYKKLR
jgi:hypothetical protein